MTIRWLARQRWRPDALALLLLAGLALVFFWPVTFNAGWIPRGGGDLVSFLWPTYSYAAQAVRAGRVPLWNPTLFSGAPFAADNQSGVFYPFNLLAFLLWPGLPYAALEWLVVAHVWLAAAGMYALVRVLLNQRSPAAYAGALVAALAFMFSDVFVTHVGNLNIVAVSAWLPWCCLALHLALTRHSAGWAAAGGVGLGVAALAGHAQMTLIVALALGVYGAGWMGLHWRDPWRVNAQRAALVVLVFAVALGVAALSVIPAVEMTQYTGRARLDYAGATEFSLPWAGLAGLFSPLVFGRGAAYFWAPWDRVEAGYAGAVTLLLAGAGLLRREGRLPWLYLALGVFGLLVALGEHTPFHRLIYTVVPGFASLRVPARFILLTDFALAALAGMGVSHFVQASRQPAAVPNANTVGEASRRGAAVPRLWAGAELSGAWRWRIAPSLREFNCWAGALLAIGVAGMVASFIVTNGSATHTRGLLLGLAVFVTLTLAGLALVYHADRPLGLAALVGLVALDLIGHGAWVEVERHDPTRGFDHPASVAYLQAQPGPVRVDNASGAWSPDAAARFGLEDIGGLHNPLALAAYNTYLGAVGSRGSPLYNFLNAQFVISDKDQPPGDSRFVPVFNEDPAVDIYLNTAAQPRVRLVYAMQPVAGGEEAFGAIHAPGFDPETQVVIDTSAGTVPAPMAGPPPDGGSNLYYVDYAPEAFTVVAEAPGAAYLVFSEVWYPGWRAALNGQAVPIHLANFAFRAIYLPEAGTHTLTMRFDPLSWKLGLALTTLTWLALAMWGGALLLLHRRSAR